MIKTYLLLRKDYVFVCHSRAITAQLDAVTDEVFMITNPNPLTRQRVEELRAQKEALLQSMEARIPKICKIIPVKK